MFVFFLDFFPNLFAIELSIVKFILKFHKILGFELLLPDYCVVCSIFFFISMIYNWL